ncbi:MAG TPA: acyltransferase [Solirubrobacteraceae bacterium]|jgi:peptidoglycan/LPS O-acetylase OafA/YrhL
MDEPRPPQPQPPDVGIGTLLAGNGVRGVGMLLVFFTHLFLLADPAPDNNMQSYGWAAPILGHIDLGLAAFFALSGYLIARPFARAYVLGTRTPRLRSYVRNRVLRVVPAFYLFTVLVLLRFGLDGTLSAGAHNSSGALQVLGQFLFVQGQTGGPAAVPIGPAWSIGAEVGFYIVIPISYWLAMRVAPRLRSPQRRAVFAILAAGAVMVLSIASRAHEQYLFAWLTSPPAIMYVFMPGVAVALAEPLLVPLLRDRARRARTIAWGAFALSALLAIAYAKTDYDPRQTPIHHALGQRSLMAALCTGALIGGLVVLQLGTGGAPRLFANRVMLWMGERSYSFYLAHIWVLFEIDHALRHSADSIATRVVIMTAIGLPLTTAIATLSYRFVERPFLERKRKVVVGGAGDGPGGSGLPPDAQSVAKPAPA